MDSRIGPGRPRWSTVVTAVCLAAASSGGAACAGADRPPGTVVMASGADLESGNPLLTVHPLSRQVQRHALFVTLVRLDSALRPQPYYARRWRWSADRTRLTMVLTPTLRWHDGVPTTAHDAAFTLEAARDPALGSPRAAELAAVAAVAAPDDTTLQLRFVRPQAALPLVLAELPLVPRHRLDTVPRVRWRAHPFSTAPVGNGPFRFAGRTPGRLWRFERWGGFPPELGGPPRLRAFVVAVVDESATKFAGLVSGELDVAGVSPAMATLVARDPTLVLETPPALFSTVLAFNTTRAPFSDPRVRRALSMAVDRRRLVAAAVAGYGTPAVGPIPPGIPFAPVDTPHVDRSGARATLDSAGWRLPPGGTIRQRGGRPLEVTLLSVGSGDLAAEQLVQADLAAIGVAVRLRVRELGAFLAALRPPARDYDLAITGIPGTLALGHLGALFNSAQRGGALDYTGFHTPELDARLDAAAAAAPDAQGRAWHEVDTLLRRDMPVAWLYHARGVQGRSRRLAGVTMDLRGELATVARWERVQP
ncbi:MAG: peptide ABC transporter substrate-binding protein [Gemmatimonadetes bacterium]|nr:peptide ABC transporter substrate-binding protein [Gemmatimonadota bacterium]